MAFIDHYERAAEFTYRCKHCDGVFNASITSLISHYAVCGGKNVPVTSRVAIDILDQAGHDTIEYVETIGRLLERKRMDVIVLGGTTIDCIRWKDILEVLAIFGFEDEFTPNK